MKELRLHDATTTTCPYCGVGCGVKVRTKQSQPNSNDSLDDTSVIIAGDENHPANFGRLCSKGYDLANTLGSSDRLTDPVVDGKITTWSCALDHIADKFRQTIDKYGPEAIAFYVSGQLLTEDYYVVNKFVKGYLGTANIDTNSRLCMSSTVAGHKRAFGSDTVPGCYEDLELANAIILVGSNLAWCHPVLYQRIRDTKAHRPSLRVILVDPRETASNEIADTHLALNPDSDIDLFTGLLSYLANTSKLDSTFIDNHTEHFQSAIDQANKLTTDQISDSTGLSVLAQDKFYEYYASTERVVTIFSQGVNQSERGTDTVNAIINCHLATGRIGKPGMGPFSVTGQPNAMGGREVGGLANMLAAHMDIENEQHRELVQSFWQSPYIAQHTGRKAVDLFKDINDGKIKAVWIMATNPVDSMPLANSVSNALSACPFVVVSDVATNTDTQDYAHVRLPALAWGEKDGTVTNSERRISRQRAFQRPTGNAKPDWWAVCEVAKRLGHEQAFSYSGPASIFREHAALSGYRNKGQRDFDISACSDLSDEDYQTLSPFQWPWQQGQKPKAKRFFADGNFYTASGRAQFVTTAPAHKRGESALYPYTLNTGRIRDQWHTMTRTGNSPRLASHLAEPFIEIHPSDANAHGIGAADLVRVKSDNGTVLLRALITDRSQQGSVFAPMHWTDQCSGQARINTLISARTDPISGQPALKSQRVSIERYTVGHYGFAIVHETEQQLLNSITESRTTYWASAKCHSGWRLEFAGELTAQQMFDNLYKQIQTHVSATPAPVVIEINDTGNGLFRLASFSENTLLAAVYISRLPVKVSRHWASNLLVESFTDLNRTGVLAARPGNDQPDIGAIVCSCFMVGSTQISEAARVRSNNSVSGIGKLLKAGTNCGSCRGEIARILKQPECDTRSA